MKYCLLIFLFPFWCSAQFYIKVNLLGGVANYTTDRIAERENEVYSENYGASYGIGLNAFYALDSSFSFGLGVQIHETNGVGSFKIKMDDNYVGQTSTTEINGVDYRVVDNIYRSEYLLQVPLIVQYTLKRWVFQNGLQLSYQLDERTVTESFIGSTGQWSEPMDFHHLETWNLSYYVGFGFSLTDKLNVKMNIFKGLRNIADRSRGYGGLIQRNQLLLGMSYLF